MRKNFLFLLGSLTGACLTVLVTGPQGEHLIAKARAAAGVVDTYSQLNLFGEVFERVRSDYVEKPDDTSLIEGAINGMVTSLDPHSRYMNDKSWHEMQETTSGEFGGLGIEVTMEDGLVKVVSPIEGSPAFRAGIKAGDLITRIDDTAVKGLTMDQAVKRMRGEPNTKVVLTLFRKTENRTFPVTITREEIRVQSVRAKVVEPGYAWMRVSQFQDRTIDDFTKKMEELYKQEPNMKGLVLDLRNDPGGLLEGAVAISAAFLPADSVVVTTNGQLADSKATFRASPGTAALRPRGNRRAHASISGLAFHRTDSEDAGAGQAFGWRDVRSNS